MSEFLGFEIASPNAVIGLGHSERAEVGEFLARTLKNYGIFNTTRVVTTNDLYRLHLKTEIEEMMSESTVISHSAFPVHMRRQIKGPVKQLLAFNPPEPLSTWNSLRRAASVARDNVTKAPGHHTMGVFGILDTMKAGVELMGDIPTSFRTMREISDGFSTVEYLADHANQFTHGRAIVHVENDGFGFQNTCDYQRAQENGISTALIANGHHNSLLFDPKWLFEQAMVQLLIRKYR